MSKFIESKPMTSEKYNLRVKSDHGPNNRKRSVEENKSLEERRRILKERIKNKK